jgi:predicted DNA-binding protein YlxM (UPF0122 family)
VGKDEAVIDRMFRTSMLLDTYGALLTEKQREFMRLHYEQDLSFGEIAGLFGVSRQAIHDSVKHAERTLENFEEKLALVEKSVFPGEWREIAERVLELKQKVRQQGIVYNSEWIVQELSRIVEQLASPVEECVETVENMTPEPALAG